MSLVLAGNTSGQTTLQATDAVTAVITLPSATDTLVGKITPSFTTTIGVGAATPSASGAGITFPATQSASTDANTLDDYEEGTWTAAVTVASGSVTMGNNTCSYLKIGKVVYIKGYIYIASVSSPSGAVTITGLPFSGDGTASAWGGWVPMDAISGKNKMYVPGGTSITYAAYNDTAIGNLLTGTWSCVINGFYSI
jgi:hypothetical protein